MTSEIFTYFHKVVALKSVYFIFFMCVCVCVYIYICWLYVSVIPKIVLNSYLLEYLVV